MAKGENKADQALDIIKEMTILELRDLNQRIQDEFGITAMAPVAVAAAPATAAGGGGGGAPHRRQRGNPQGGRGSDPQEAAGRRRHRRDAIARNSRSG